MKKTIVIFSILFVSLTACKKKEAKPKFNYSIDPKTTVVKWTAYKTTDKVPVSGTFKAINIINAKKENSPQEALNTIQFKIPVNSIDSKNADRDAKLVNAFFGTMKDTQFLSGTIKTTEKGKGSVYLTMNGIGKDFPINYVISGQLIEINTSIDLNNWQVKAAIDALNKVCFDKHKGADGISKTWNEVTLNIKTYLKVEEVK